MSKLLNVNTDLKSSSPDIKLADEFVKKYIDEEDISLIEKINKQLKNNRRFYKISIKLHIQPFYLLLILLTPVLILLLTFFSFTTKIITTFYPLYMSMKTLQYQVNKRTEDGRLYRQVDEDNDTTKWLSYWLLYSFIINTECLLQSLVDKIPLYKLIKFLILLSCFIPQIEFNVIIYNYFTRKIFILYGEKFEQMKLENLFMDNKKEEEIIEKPLKQEDSNTPVGESFNQRKKIE